MLVNRVCTIDIHRYLPHFFLKQGKTWSPFPSENLKVLFELVQLASFEAYILRLTIYLLCLYFCTIFSRSSIWNILSDVCSIYWNWMFMISTSDLQLYKKVLQHRCFLVNFAKFLWTPFLQNTSGGCFRTLQLEKVINFAAVEY